MHVCMHTHANHGFPVAARGHLVGVSSLLLSCESQGQNSGLVATALTFTYWISSLPHPHLPIFMNWITWDLLVFISGAFLPPMFWALTVRWTVAGVVSCFQAVSFLCCLFHFVDAFYIDIILLAHFLFPVLWGLTQKILACAESLKHVFSSNIFST